MSNILLLDCTLRDGGYTNDWNFMIDNIHFIIDKLQQSEVDLIEIGYFNPNLIANKDSTLYVNHEQINSIIRFYNRKNFAIMINHGEASPIEVFKNIPRDIIIRYAFHKSEMNDALLFVTELVEMNYKVYLQPMVTKNYSESEIIALIEKVNIIKPSAFYIVDSFGSIGLSDLNNIIAIVDNYLNNEIKLGLHTHDNRELSLLNSMKFVELLTNKRDYLIIDCSVNGMGRGAGNLKTETIIPLLNEEYSNNYKIVPVLEIIDVYINEIFERPNWGKSLTMQLTGEMNIHPNYGKYLEDIGLLTYEELLDILRSIPLNDKSKYNERLIRDLYLEKFNFRNDLLLNKQLDLSKKPVLLVAPGTSSIDFINSHNIKNLKNKYTVILINHVEDLIADYTFFSKHKRLSQYEPLDFRKVILTDNLINQNGALVIPKRILINKTSGVEDNAGLMAIKMLILFRAAEINLVGFDGYAPFNASNKNYKLGVREVMLSNSRIHELNAGLREVIKAYSTIVSIKFLTNSIYCK
jgi:4-hydroxy 2-oxovalerate aldolase